MKFWRDEDGVYHTAKSKAGKNPELLEIKPDKATILELLNSKKEKTLIDTLEVTGVEHDVFCSGMKWAGPRGGTVECDGDCD